MASLWLWIRTFRPTAYVCIFFCVCACFNISTLNRSNFKVQVEHLPVLSMKRGFLNVDSKVKVQSFLHEALECLQLYTELNHRDNHASSIMSGRV